MTGCEGTLLEGSKAGALMALSAQLSMDLMLGAETSFSAACRGLEEL